ncbi:MAG TPA: type III secretion system cytoplasmic ring protein SctQ [Candidatus Avidesulfovibrio excrementigallinarum]|nr:type III secretion system cytoplasmic ring protein SctQ [Candidatus Avidesulfovibrio excrementigallinarum]
MPSEKSVRPLGVPALSPLRVRLLNALVARALPAEVLLDAGADAALSGRLAVNSAAAAALESAPFAPAATLFVQSGGALWKLEWSSLEALGLRPELRQWRESQAADGQDFALLPEGLRLAVLERLLAPSLAALGNFLGCETRCAACPVEPAWSEPVPLALTLPGGGATVFLRLYWSDEGAARFILERLETLPLRARPASAGNCAVPCRLEVGGMRLTPEELAGLACGDVLLPERWTPETPLLCPQGGAALVCRLSSGELTVVGPDAAASDAPGVTSKSVEVSMSEPVAEHGEEAAAGGQPLLDEAAVGAMELPVTFELASLQLRVDELAALQPGYTLALGGDVASVPIGIRVGGRMLAHGRLVDVGGMPGVQIVALEPAGAPENAGTAEDAVLQEGNTDGTGRD